MSRKRRGLIVGLALALLALPAHADDRADCDASKDPDTTIKGCSAIIDVGTDTAAIIALAHHLRGAAHHGKGEYDRAIKDYDRAIALAPENAGMYNDRAIAYKGRGDNERAFADYDRAIELDPKMAKAYFNRGIHFGQQGNYNKAIQDFERATALNTEYVEAFYMRGLMYALQRDYSGAIKDYDRAIALNPEYVEAVYARGYIYEERGDTEKAVAAYRKALALRPDLALAKEGLARLEASPKAANNDWDDCNGTDGEAVIRGCSAIIEAGTETAKNLALAYDNRSNAYDFRSDWRLSVEDQARAVALDPKKFGTGILKKPRRIYFPKSIERKRAQKLACANVMLHAHHQKTLYDLKQSVDDCNNHPNCEVTIETMIETTDMNPEKIGLTCKRSN